MPTRSRRPARPLAPLTKAKTRRPRPSAQKAYQALFAPFYETMKESQKKLDNVLTPEQKEKQLNHQMSMWIKAITDPVKLSDEQMAKAKQVFREMKKTTDHERMERGLPDAIQKILTDEQKLTIKKHRIMSYAKATLGRVELTAEQKAKLDALVSDMAKEANPRGDWKSMQKITEKAQGLLTAEQKEALKKNPWGLGRCESGAWRGPISRDTAQPRSNRIPAARVRRRLLGGVGRRADRNASRPWVGCPSGHAQ